MNRPGSWIARCLIAIALALFGHPAVAAQSNANEKRGTVSVQLEGAHPHLTVGRYFSIIGTITNNSDETIYVSEKFLKLKFPREMEGPNAATGSFWRGQLFAEDFQRDDKHPFATMALSPGSSTCVWWIWNQTPFNNGVFTYLFFEPGSYRITADVSYWRRDDLVGLPDRVVDSTNLDVAAPLPIILLGAAIGGLVACIVLPQARKLVKKNWFQYAASLAASILGNVILALVISILWARLADAASLLRLTVSDVWGGIAVGFIANYLGIELINKMIRIPQGAAGAGGPTKPAVQPQGAT